MENNSELLNKYKNFIILQHEQKLLKKRKLSQYLDYINKNILIRPYKLIL